MSYSRIEFRILIHIPMQSQRIVGESKVSGSVLGAEDHIPPMDELGEYFTRHSIILCG